MTTLTESFSRLLPGNGSSPQSRIASRSFCASLMVHGALILIAGAFVVSHIFHNGNSTFKGQPPPMKSYEPKKVEFKVKVSNQQRSSSRPSMSPRMASSKVSANVALPEVKMASKAVQTSFQPKFKTFGGAGLGNGLGGGYGPGGFGDGASVLDFFGIRVCGDKVLILVDVSISMIEDEKGGIKAYDRVKNRINKVIDAINESGMFNVIVFADAVSSFSTNLVVGTDDNRNKARQFLHAFNTPGNYGLTTGNLHPPQIGIPAAGGTTRMDLALTAAFEEGADTILIISDGLPEVKKGVTPEMAQAHAVAVQRWQTANTGALAQWESQAAAVPPVQTTAERVWIPPRPARPPQVTGIKEGQTPDPGGPAEPGHWQVVTHSSGSGGGHPPRPEPPKLEPGMWTLNDFIQHCRTLHETLHVKTGMKMPVIHTILYGTDKEGRDFLKTLAETYHGRFRSVTRVD